MVTRAAPVLLALLLAGCPDDLGNGGVGVSTGLVAPADFAAVPNGGSQILLTWTDLATNETGYRLEMNDVPFGTPTIADVRFLPAASTRYVYPTLPNQTYYFRVVAITATMESDPSPILQVRTPDVPVQPTGLAARTISSSQIELTWTDVANVVAYRLQRSIDGISWSLVEHLMAGTVVWMDVGLTGDTSYVYRLIAYNQNGDSTPSETVLGLTATASMTLAGVASSTDGGTFASCAVLPDGSEQVSYYRPVTGDVFFSWRMSGGSFGTTFVDGGLLDAGGDGTSIALDGTGTAHVVAHNRTSSTLRYATNPGGFWIASDIEGGGARPRIACNPADGTLHVVHQTKPSAGNVFLRHATKPPGQPWSVSDLSPGAAILDSVHSIALDSDGVLHVFLVATDGSLWWIRKPPPSLGGTTGQQILIPGPHGAPDFTSVVVDPAGTIHGFYRGSLSKSLHHVWQAGSGLWNLETVHEVAGEDFGAYCSAAIQPATGRLHVAYYDALRGDLRYARKDPGGAWVLRIIDVAGNVGSHAWTAVDASGVVHIAYRDETNRVLKVAAGSP